MNPSSSEERANKLVLHRHFSDAKHAVTFQTLDQGLVGITQQSPIPRDLLSKCAIRSSMLLSAFILNQAGQQQCARIEHKSKSSRLLTGK